MTQETEIPPQAELRAYLAEHMSVVREMTFATWFQAGGSWTEGSDRRYLLRRKCPCSMTMGRIGGSRNFNVCDACYSRSGHADEQCTNCSGLGYVYDDSPNALTEAVRAKGWQYKHEGYHADVGDSVLIMNSIAHDIARVNMKDNLRGTEALEVALYRACRAEVDHLDKGCHPWLMDEI